MKINGNQNDQTKNGELFRYLLVYLRELFTADPKVSVVKLSGVQLKYNLDKHYWPTKFIAARLYNLLSECYENHDGIFIFKRADFFLNESNGGLALRSTTFHKEQWLVRINNWIGGHVALGLILFVAVFTFIGLWLWMSLFIALTFLAAIVIMSTIIICFIALLFSLTATN